MNENKKELLKNAIYDTSGKWIRSDNIEVILEDVIQECIRLVRQAPTNCAFTTFDLGVVECTIDNCAKQLINHFEITEKARHETIVG